MAIVEFLRGDASTSIPCDGERSVLDHALSHGIEVDYSCRRGDCGQCRATLTDGTVKPLDPSRSFGSDGSVLLCNVIADQGAVVRLPYDPEMAGLRTVHVPAKVHRLADLGGEVIEVALRLPASAQFRFLPGQFIRLRNAEQVTRAYSLAAPPSADNLLYVHVRRVRDGAFSDYLSERARVGDLLRLEGPQGRMFLRKQPVPKSIFLATGTGIAPVLAMIQGLNDEMRTACGDIYLYWGNRRRSDAYCEGLVNELARRFQFQSLLLFSGETGRFRHVQDAAFHEHGGFGVGRVYAAGHPGMVAEAKRLFTAAGLGAEEFYADPFTAS